MVEKVPVKAEPKAVTPSSTFGSWAPFESLRREVDHLFERFASPGRPLPLGRQMFSLDFPWLDKTSGFLAPAIDVIEKDQEFELTAELPGLDEKNIDVKISEDLLTIKGEKKEEKEEREKEYYLSERRFGSFTRSFQLPAGVDASKIEATFTKGVLTIKLPKTPEAQKSEKTIEIKAG
ncbi:Hsp20/alpha crystallin family protein [Beijerinckia indica]|uniref:Heat shock protein Hsp20 n=1 Tax=Beijerinckia indica subsp. indica (strain ATCC 9039 / DSM 1715 / NCIMB 8712) TaxID=395963 RepID=B2II78_BEII9|nr:Hsp20/alpha crystallin family protein [Beijerinckia indica]ACB94661.1 heat shock protein Hsp20 [Beijerinckia indica subsp. indica ATCC 9039]